MRVVQLTLEDAAGAAWRLHRAINEMTEHSSVLFRRDDNRLRYPTQFTFEDSSLLRGELARADVVHVHQESPWLLQLSSVPRKVISHYGSRYRENRRLYDVLDRRAGAYRTASNLELAGYAPDLIHLPVAVFFQEWKRRSEGRARGRVFRIAHSPATPARRALKGTDRLLEIGAELRANGLAVEIVLIEGRPWSESLEMRATCDATFDSFWLGMQCSGAEAACMDQPVLAGDHHVAARYKQRYGYVPYTFVTPDTLKEKLRRLVLDEGYYERERLRVARHVRTYHDMSVIAERYDEILRDGGSSQTVAGRL